MRGHAKNTLTHNQLVAVAFECANVIGLLVGARQDGNAWFVGVAVVGRWLGHSADTQRNRLIK